VVYILTCPADAARDRAANAPWGPRIIATAPIESVSITGLTMLSRHITDALLRPERIAQRLSQSRPAVLSPGQGARLAITRPGTRASDVVPSRCPRRAGPIVSERTAFTPSIGAWIGPPMQISWRRQSGRTHLFAADLGYPRLPVAAHGTRPLGCRSRSPALQASADRPMNGHDLEGS
jgi:hypothetical protein